MRLIDADEMLINESEAFMKAQAKCDSLTAKINQIVHTKIQKLISDTPTAYDVDKVLSKLDQHKTNLTDWAEDRAFKLGIETGEKEVRAGGIDENN